MKKIILLLILISSVTKANEKMMLLYIEMDYCGWCTKMDKEVFENPSILKQITEIYNVKMMKRGDKNIPLDLSTDLYPTTYIISKDGKKVIAKLRGYMNSKDYLEYLQLLE